MHRKNRKKKRGYAENDIMKCKNEECNNDVREGYTYCMPCYERWKAKSSPAPNPAKSGWHDDPVVDQLMKINANLGRIAQELEKDECER
jgi:hypothetical protein